jgi:hypothetical protein
VVLAFAGVIIALLALLVFAPKPNQCVLVSRPQGPLELKSDIGTFRNVTVSEGRLVISIGNLGERQGSPFASGQWVVRLQPGTDILLEGALELRGRQYSSGARFTVDKDHNFVVQALLRRAWNITKSFVWNLKHPKD